MNPELGLEDPFHQTAEENPKILASSESPEGIVDIARLEHRIDDLALQTGVKEPAWQKFRLIMSELRDYSPQHYAHGLRVGLYSHGIAKNEGHGDLKLPIFAGVGHDIGKLAVSRDILDTDGMLSEKEYEEVKQHTYAGYEILYSSDFPFTAVVAGAHHFFRPNGKGYGVDPGKVNSLTNAEKFIASNMVRIVMLADDFDARMTRVDNRNGQHGLSLKEHTAQMSAEFPLEEERIDWLATNKL